MAAHAERAMAHFVHRLTGEYGVCFSTHHAHELKCDAHTPRTHMGNHTPPPPPSHHLPRHMAHGTASPAPPHTAAAQCTDEGPMQTAPKMNCTVELRKRYCAAAPADRLYREVDMQNGCGIAAP